MSMDHQRTTVADMRAIKARGQKTSMLYVSNCEEDAAALQKKVELRKDNPAQ
jgi:3-methyl-2-oxobutanoate hydroxymethyltransferase